MVVQIKRIYDAPNAGDGFRVLVDRIWPRGIRKDDAALDEWLKDVAPSTELRTWFGHDADRFAEFESRYRVELASNPAVAELRHIIDTHRAVTLLYGARDTVHNQASALRDYLAQG